MKKAELSTQSTASASASVRPLCTTWKSHNEIVIWKTLLVKQTQRYATKYQKNISGKNVCDAMETLWGGFGVQKIGMCFWGPSNRSLINMGRHWNNSGQVRPRAKWCLALPPIRQLRMFCLIGTWNTYAMCRWTTCANGRYGQWFCTIMRMILNQSHLT